MLTACSSASASWAGQEVFLKPHLMSLQRLIYSSTVMPAASAAISEADEAFFDEDEEQYE